MTLGENIRKIRQEKGLTQKQLGELCGINEVQIRRYELGNANPKIETIEKIANALQCSVYELRGMPEETIAFNEKIDIIKKINDIYITELSFLTECDMPPKQVKDYIAKCKIASEQISNDITECKTAYKQMKNYIPKYDLAEKQSKNHIAKYQSNTRNGNAELPEELKKLWKEHDSAFNQLNNPMETYTRTAKKLNNLLESECGTETLFHIAGYDEKAKQASIKNTENETSLAKIKTLFCKLNADGQKEMLKRLEELTHLKQYTDK